MTGTDRFGGALPRYVAVLVAAVLGLSLFPAAAGAQQAQGDPCEGAPVANEYVDRSTARDVHEESIDCVIYRSIAVGSTNAQGQQIYQPLNPVTRDQMASFVAQALVAGGYGGELPDGEGADEFDDIAGNVHRLNINRLARAGIVNGTDENSYSPRGLITRQQMASFMVQAAEFAFGRELESDSDFPFTDVSASNVHRENINKGEDEGLFRGVTATQFRPGLNVLRDQMATFLVNLLRAIFNAETAPPVIQATDASVRPGEPVTGTIRGNVQSVTVSGCGLTNQSVSDANSGTSGFQFSVTPTQTTPGTCTLTFRITLPNGEVFEETLGVTIEAPGATTSFTTAPELIRVELVRTTTQNQSNADNPAGTTYRLIFDEPIPGTIGASTLAHVITFDNRRFNADFVARDTTRTDALLVRFNAIDTTDEVAELTMLTVDSGLVIDQPTQTFPNGQTNPIADLPLGEATRTIRSSRQAGVQNNPYLTAAGPFRGGNVTLTAPAGSNPQSATAVDLTFSEPVFVANTSGVRLVLTNNNVAQCTLSTNTGDASGGTSPGGSGTNKLTAVCFRAIGQGGNAPITAEDVARVVIAAGTVTDTGGLANQTNAVDVSNGGNANDAPNLASGEFQPDNDTDTDLVFFVFTEQVTVPTDASLFRVITDTGAEISGTAFGNPVRDPNNLARVLVVFPDGTVNRGVGVAVLDGAVTDVDDGTANRADEQAVTPTVVETTVQAGLTTGPDLTDVRLEIDRNAVNQITRVVGVFDFDEVLTAINNTTTGTSGAFRLLNSDGTPIGCDALEQGTDSNSGRDTVRCLITDAGNPGSSKLTGASTAVAGTVDDGAVRGSSGATGDTNNEGFDGTGAGTPRS